MTPLLNIDALAVDYRGNGGALVHAVSDVGLTLQRGEILALVGESGSGKSTTAQAVAGLLDPNARIVGGGIVFDGVDLVDLPERRFRALRGRRIGFVPQDPTVSLNPVLTIGKQIADVAFINGLADKRGAQGMALEMLEKVGISQPLLRAGQFPHELSGGMRQRVLIGMAMLCRPDLLIADEPTSALDVTVQRTILDLIERLARESDTAVLLITHDLGVAGDRADRIAVMQQGKVVENGTTADVLERPRHAYTQALWRAVPANVGFHARIPPVSSPDAALLVRLGDIGKRFAGRGGEVIAVEAASFSIRKGETFALVGESGSGKTTISRIVAGLERADQGSYEMNGAQIDQLHSKALRAFRRDVQMVYQNPYASLNPRMPVGEIVREPMRAFGLGTRNEQWQKVEHYLHSVGLGMDHAKRLPQELSGGQRQRVAIARALVLEPSLIVLDEPVSALDVSIQAQILALLDRLQKERNLTYLFVSHDLAVVRTISDRIAVMKSGRIIETGVTQAIFEHPAEAYTRELIAAIPGQREKRP